MVGMKTNAPTISSDQYKAAADRIRRGCSRLGDRAICNAYDAQQVLPGPARARRWWDLPVAQRCWSADGADLNR